MESNTRRSIRDVITAAHEKLAEASKFKKIFAMQKEFNNAEEQVRNANEQALDDLEHAMAMQKQATDQFEQERIRKESQLAKLQEEMRAASEQQLLVARTHELEVRNKRKAHEDLYRNLKKLKMDHRDSIKKIHEEYDNELVQANAGQPVEQSDPTQPTSSIDNLPIRPSSSDIER